MLNFKLKTSKHISFTYLYYPPTNQTAKTSLPQVTGHRLDGLRTQTAPEPSDDLRRVRCKNQLRQLLGPWKTQTKRKRVRSRGFYQRGVTWQLPRLIDSYWQSAMAALDHWNCIMTSLFMTSQNACGLLYRVANLKLKKSAGLCNNKVSKKNSK